MVAELTTNQRIAKDIFRFTKEHDWPEKEELVSNHTLFSCIHCGVDWDMCCDEAPEGKCYLTPKAYDSDISAAWELVEFLRNLKPLCVTLNVHVKPERGYEVFCFMHGPDAYMRWRDEGLGSVGGTSIPETICKAALLAIEKLRK